MPGFTPRSGAPEAALPDQVKVFSECWAAEAKPQRQMAHLPSWPLPSLVAVDSMRKGLESGFQPRAATYNFWKAERAVISSGPFTSGLVSAGVLESEQAVSSASRISARVVGARLAVFMASFL